MLEIVRNAIARNIIPAGVAKGMMYYCLNCPFRATDVDTAFTHGVNNKHHVKVRVGE